MNGQGPCIVQSDLTVLLDAAHPEVELARVGLRAFAEQVKTPSSFHTYRITPLSLWNAAARGWKAEDVLGTLHRLSRFSLPGTVEEQVTLWMPRYGQLTLVPSQQDPDILELAASTEGIKLLDELLSAASLKPFGLQRISTDHLQMHRKYRGLFKQEMTRLGYPVVDQAGYRSGAALPVELRTLLRDGSSFKLRDYQLECADVFTGDKQSQGSGVLVLPCGAGKTVVGLRVMENLKCETLILTSNITSVRQWIEEICSKTTLDEAQIGEYSGEVRQVRPVTVSTYQILSRRSRTNGQPAHLHLLDDREWGLIIYDEVHLLPAPVFRATADIQATRRLGLTATLVREDGCERDVFSLIGPKQMEVPWKTLEQQGWIAKVECHEIRIPLEALAAEQYAAEMARGKFRVAAENPAKAEAARLLIEQHQGRQILIIGQFLRQLQLLQETLDIPLITGSTPQEERSRLYKAFRSGEITVLAVSKVANFALDLPDAAVAVQLSGSFGSRQEEAQRLGRILRPKTGDNRGYFYSLVSEGTREQEFSRKRQLFLIEQGYEYSIHQAAVSPGRTDAQAVKGGQGER